MSHTGKERCQRKILFDRSEQMPDQDTRTYEQIRQDVRTEWRNCETIEQFIKLANLDPFHANCLDIGHRAFPVTDVHKYIWRQAKNFCFSVKCLIQDEKYEGIQWIEPPETAEKQDLIVFLYVDLLRVDSPSFLNSEQAQRYYGVLKQIIPETPPPPRLSSHLAREIARTFHRGSRGGRDIARPLLRAIW